MAEQVAEPAAYLLLTFALGSLLLWGLLFYWVMALVNVQPPSAGLAVTPS